MFLDQLVLEVREIPAVAGRSRAASEVDRMDKRDHDSPFDGAPEFTKGAGNISSLPLTRPRVLDREAQERLCSMPKSSAAGLSSPISSVIPQADPTSVILRILKNPPQKEIIPLSMTPAATCSNVIKGIKNLGSLGPAWVENPPRCANVSAF